MLIMENQGPFAFQEVEGCLCEFISVTRISFSVFCVLQELVKLCYSAMFLLTYEAILADHVI